MPAMFAAEGGYQEFILNGGEWTVLVLSAVAALVAIAVGFYLAKSVLAADEGSPKMREIAHHIQVGASRLPQAAVQDDRRDPRPGGGDRVLHVDRHRQA